MKNIVATKPRTCPQQVFCISKEFLGSKGL